MTEKEINELEALAEQNIKRTEERLDQHQAQIERQSGRPLEAKYVTMYWEWVELRPYDKLLVDQFSKLGPLDWGKYPSHSVILKAFKELNTDGWEEIKDIYFRSTNGDLEKILR